MTVLSLDDRSWVVSIRGSARLYSDKILVMIDGRSLYTPLFSGVIWDAIDVPLGDVEQIEVVRGPGAVMWGPNAVNGVINIITKKAQQTKGTPGHARPRAMKTAQPGIPLGRGSQRPHRLPDLGKTRLPDSGLRLARRLSTSTHLSYRDPAIRNLDTATGRMGFRVDGQPNEKDQWMIQGDLYQDRPAGSGRLSSAVQPAVDRDAGSHRLQRRIFAGTLDANQFERQRIRGAVLL